MPTCAKGHTSTDPDFCDVCGRPLEGGQAPEWRCPHGHGPQAGRYCEVCGHDSTSSEGTTPDPAPPEETPRTAAVPPEEAPRAQAATETTWVLTADADRDYHRVAGAPAGLPFPNFLPTRRFHLGGGTRLLIGRADPNRGVDPEIDLSGPPEDRAIGRSHALLVARPDGGWSIVDLGSTNRTYLNDHHTPLTPDVEVPLSDGDRLYLGAWTVLTLRAT